MLRHPTTCLAKVLAAPIVFESMSTALSLPEFLPLVEQRAQAQFGKAFIGVLLYGSKARGDAFDGSDTDLLIVVDSSIQLKRSLYTPWENLLPDTVSIQIARLPDEASAPGRLWLECALDAKILVDSEGKLRSHLTQVNRLILAGKFVRKTTHGQGYWIST